MCTRVWCILQINISCMIFLCWWVVGGLSLPALVVWNFELIQYWRQNCTHKGIAQAQEHHYVQLTCWSATFTISTYFVLSTFLSLHLHCTQLDYRTRWDDKFAKLKFSLSSNGTARLTSLTSHVWFANFWSENSDEISMLLFSLFIFHPLSASASNQ